MSSDLESRFASGEESPGFMLWRVTNQWQAAIRIALKPHGITHVQFVLLASLTWSNEDGGVTQAELSHRTHTDPMMVSQVVRALTEKGLVRRDRDVNDGRAMRVSVTAKGQDIARAANRAVEAADGEYFGVHSSEAHTLISHLHALDRRNNDAS